MGDAQQTPTDFMRRALALAARAEGFTAPNPLVGCVVVSDGEIVGEGWHRGAGLPHAEVEALSAAGARAAGSTLYVTLEPCNHTGRTPPCSCAVIDAGVREVVYALSDPTRLAGGGGAALRENGVAISSGVCADEARHQNRFWLKRIAAGRPYVTAKFAASLDGKIATRTGDSRWITGAQARADSHRLRRMCDAVIVGVETVVADDPALTDRTGEAQVSNPLRIVLDSTARTPPSAAMFDRAAPGALVVAAKNAPRANLDRLETMGVETLLLDTDHQGRPDLIALLEALGARGLNGVMVEGGGAVLGSFFDADLVDEVWAYVAPVIIGGDAKAPVGGAGAQRLSNAWRLVDAQSERLGDDIVWRGAVANKETG
ncbi:MAG: bifunctional diaminohydroxyphosphoribosylaminopyrimidine deaminase/5-amino-6-(5-phosphoribosylamino)uracil reductase RibD [Pseudomonadota bacterium]